MVNGKLNNPKHDYEIHTTSTNNIFKMIEVNQSSPARPESMMWQEPENLPGCNITLQWYGDRIQMSREEH